MKDDDDRSQYTRLQGSGSHEYPQNPIKNQVQLSPEHQNRNNAFVIAFL